jgi:eukaryotic-like serine/threonine-protein kinase
LKGTLAFMTPEQLEMKTLTPQSDIFSPGVVTYEMLALRRPFQGKTPAELVEAVLHQTPRPASEFKPSLPLNFGRVIHKALVKNPLHCYASAKVSVEKIRLFFPNLALIPEVNIGSPF